MNSVNPPPNPTQQAPTRSTGCPDPLALLKEHFGFGQFRPGQREVIEALYISGRALAVFPTGAGKSLCFQLPAITFEGITLVVSPLIALMKDQIDFLAKHGVPAARLDSMLEYDELREVMRRLRSGELKLLYVAPERFNNERFLSAISPLRISLFAIDEAHCISEWGHNFRPDYLKLAEIAKEMRAERILALTATATPSVVKDICRAFDIAPECAIVTGFYRPNLNIAITAITAAQRDQLLIKRFEMRRPGPAIVYVTLQKTAERVAEMLTGAGFPAEAYHAGMEPGQRHAVQERWMASDKGIVVATIAFGMGIDKADVRYVYHYNMSKSLESYSQEIGRAGRDGLKSTVEMLLCAEDIPVLENFAYGDTPTATSIRGLVTELLSQPREFNVSLYELADRHDIRILVLRTALTYLELAGILRQGTPFYAGYKVQPAMTAEEVAGQFKGEHAQFIRDLFRLAKKGKTWYSFNAEHLAAAMNQPRERLVRALEVLEQRGYAVVEVAEVRQRYTRLKEIADPEPLITDLLDRFLRRETLEIQRLQQVISLGEYQGCQTNALAAHFGEYRSQPCGHCLPCVTKRFQKLAPAPVEKPPTAALDTRELISQRNLAPNALAEPRQIARFLCGLTSPALVRARLTRHSLFGLWEQCRFHDVLEWCTEFVDSL